MSTRADGVDPPSGPLVELEHVAKEYRPGDQVLRNVSLELQANQTTAILGVSGSGKTTLLSILGLLEAPSGGRYRLDGEEMFGLSDRRRAEIRRDRLSFVFQAFHLVPYLTAAENVEESLRIGGVPARERRERAAEALERIGLSARAHERPRQLSGGEQQRVAVARAVVRSPRLLLCDEPTGNLDSKNAELVLEAILASASPTCAVVVVTHDVGIAQSCAAELRVSDGFVERIR